MASRYTIEHPMIGFVIVIHDHIEQRAELLTLRMSLLVPMPLRPLNTAIVFRNLHTHSIYMEVYRRGAHMESFAHMRSHAHTHKHTLLINLKTVEACNTFIHVVCTCQSSSWVRRRST